MLKISSEASLNKTNYSRVSVLPIVSKLFEKIIQKQINGFISNSLSPYLYGYRKGYNTQQALLARIEKWKKISMIKVMEVQY